MSEDPASRQTDAPPVPAKPADAYGQPISAERQAELRGFLDRWQAETDHGDRKGPFDNGPGKVQVPLTGADLSWLVEQSRRDKSGPVPNLHLQGAHLDSEHLEGAFLAEAHLEGTFLAEAHLDGAILADAHLQGASLVGAHLEGPTSPGRTWSGPTCAGRTWTRIPSYTM